MKKILLSAVSVMACMSMSAAVPQLQDQFTGSIAVKQEAPNYSNPSTYDTDGNLIMTGAFDDTFGSLEATGTSAYIIKYDKTNKEAWRVGLTGAATITSITTDDLDNIYVAGTLADIVEFGTTSGTPIEKEGMKINGTPTVNHQASFIAKYDKAGKVSAVETFVPSILPALVPYQTQLSDWGTPLYEPGSRLKFIINKIEACGDKVYASALYSGLTEKGSAKFEGSYFDMFGEGWAYDDVIVGGVFAASVDDLSQVELKSTFASKGKTTELTEQALSATVAVAKDGSAYAGFVGSGSLVLKFGDNSKEFNYVNTSYDGDNIYGYVFVALDGTKEPIDLETKSATSYYTAMNISDMIVAGNKLYAVASYIGHPETQAFVPEATLPAAGEGKFGSNGSRIFVSAINIPAFNLESTQVYDKDAGTSMVMIGKEEKERPNNQFAYSAASVDGALYINTVVENFNHEPKNTASVWFDGTAFSAAPVAATGIAVGSVNGNGVVALPSSNATALDYKTFTFVQTGIENIGADFDENAPVEYFNLQGIRVANPENGLYIRRQGNKVEKVIVK